MALEREIRVNDMTFTYPEMEEPVLSHVNVTIPKNSSVAFIGPSGAGKTTMVDLILGVLKPQEGQITLDGVDISTSYRGWHDKIGYIPQTIYMLVIRSATILHLEKKKESTTRMSGQHCARHSSMNLWSRSRRGLTR